MNQAKVHNHKLLTVELNQVFEEKNKAYGDSFAKTLEEYGPAVLLIRLEDKLNRAKQLLLNPGSIPDNGESVRDTLMDLANYAVMGVMELGLGVNLDVISDVADYTQEEPEPEHAAAEEVVPNEHDPELVSELGEYTKPELEKIGAALDLKFGKKDSKEDRVNAILKFNPDDIANAIEEGLFQEDKGNGVNKKDKK